MSKTYEYGELGKEEKKKALADYTKRSLVLEKHKHSIALNKKDIKVVAESHLLYSKDTIHERFDKQGSYLGLFNVHEESVNLDF